MDEGLPASWEVLQPDTPVFASDGTNVGKVKKVLAVEEEDIFEGILLDTEHGERFVEAEQVGSIHERGVDLKIDAACCAALLEPEPAPAVMEVGPDDTAEPARAYKRDIWLKRIWDRISGNY
jgi:hypothetical protein